MVHQTVLSSPSPAGAADGPLAGDGFCACPGAGDADDTGGTDAVAGADGAAALGVPADGAGSTTGTAISFSPWPRDGNPTSTVTFQLPGGSTSAVLQPVRVPASRTRRQGPIVREPSGLAEFTVAPTASSMASPSFSQVISVVTWPSRCPVTTTLTVSPWAWAAVGTAKAWARNRNRKPSPVRTGKAGRVRIVGCSWCGGMR